MVGVYYNASTGGSREKIEDWAVTTDAFLGNPKKKPYHKPALVWTEKAKVKDPNEFVLCGCHIFSKI